MSNQGPIHLLTGCTACGKTELALAWAERFQAEIVSCDSLLFYRGMDLGTAKPTVAERARVPHHLIDIVEIEERIDVKRYAELAQAAVADITARGRAVLVVGGSGFYLKSFLEPVADDVPVDLAVRAGIEVQLADEGLAALVRRLEALNPGGLGTLDVNNPRRVVRALERCVVSGATLEELARRFRAKDRPFGDREVRVVELARETDELKVRVEARVRAMFAAGLVDEVRTLRRWGLEQNPSAASAIGYREVLAWLDSGSGEEQELMDAIAQNTWGLVRKQRTWFRTQLPEHRILTLRGQETVDTADLFAAEG